MASDNLITKRGLRVVQLEMLYLRTEERPQVVAEVGYAASLGDRSENAEYIYGKKRLRQIDSRLGYLTRALDRVQVIDPGEITSDKVQFGATVVVETEEGDERTYRIYGEQEVDLDAGIISHKSPIAKALLGKEEGDGVRFKAPKGWRELEIVEIRYEPQEEIPDPDWLANRTGPTSVERGDGQRA